MTDDTILTIEELANYLKVSKSLIRNLVGKGEIPHFKLHRRILFRFIDIKEWINEQ